MYYPIFDKLPITLDRSLTQRLRAISGLTFFKDYRHNMTSSNADFSIGSPTATYAATRSASAPATYVDANGVIQLLTTSDVRRRQGGYYDTTGFHVQSGELIERLGTNLLLHSYFDVDTDADGVADSWGSEISGVTASIESSSIYGNAQKFILDGSEGNYYDATQSVTVSNSTKYTISFYVKSSGWNGTSKVYVEVIGNGGYGGDTFTFPTSNYTTDWIKVTKTITTTGTQTSLGLRLARETVGGTTGTIWFSCIQIEQSPYATSFIPTTTVALTRGAESISYLTSNNRTLTPESIFIKFSPKSGTFANDGIGRVLLDNGSGTEDRRLFIKDTTGTGVNWKPDNVVAVATSTIPQANTSYVVAGVCKTTGDPNAQVYTNGVQENGDVNTDFTFTSFGTNFYIGSRFSAINQFDGLIQAIAFYNRALSAAEIVLVTNLLNSGGL